MVKRNFTHNTTYADTISRVVCVCLAGPTTVNPAQRVWPFPFYESVLRSFSFFYFFLWKPAKDAYWAGTLESTTRRLGGMSVSQSPAVTATLWPTVTRRLPPPKLAIIYAS